MKSIIMLAALLVGASAEARINTQDLTAAQAKALVAESGSIVLATSASGYDRFVANVSFCAAGEKAAPAYVPTLDRNSAFIGYVCVSAGANESVSAKSFARTAAVCREGKTQVLHEQSREDSDRQEAVTYVCTNGKWKRILGADTVGPKKTVCKEGRLQSFNETDPRNSDRQIRVTYVCRGGKYYKLY